MLTSDPQQLIVLRALMGIGAAAIMPTTLSVITTSFPVEDRPKAIGVWVGVAGGGAVLGLFGSGILLEFFSWSSFFGLNVVLAALALVGTLRRARLGRRGPAAARPRRCRAVTRRRRGDRLRRSSRARSAAGATA